MLLPQNTVQLLSSFFFLIAYLVFDLENREKLKKKRIDFGFSRPWRLISCWKSLLLILCESGSFQQCNDYPNLYLLGGESTLNKTKIAMLAQSIKSSSI